jgi:hypothetical protein
MTDVFSIVPAGPRAMYFLATVCLFLALVMALLAWVAYSTRHSRVEVGPDAIRMVGDLWGRSVPLAALDLAHARKVDLGADPELRPTSRRLGTGMPGYAAGWFRLANGEKALVYVSDAHRVAYVPTTEGYSLLLSVEQPDALLEALRRRVSR